MEAHEIHLTAAVVHFFQELRVRSDVFLLWNRGEEGQGGAAVHYARNECGVLNT